MIYYNFVNDSLHKASLTAMKHFGNVSGIVKDDDNNQVLTQADLDIGNYLISQIKEEYPDHKISVTKELSMLNTLVAYGIDGHQENPDLTYGETKVLSEIILNCRNLRTTNSAYDMVQVAVGACGASMNKTSKIWDNVAQQVVLEEAGAVYTDYYGKQIDYKNPLNKASDNFTWCTSNTVLHAKLQEIVHDRS